MTSMPEPELSIIIPVYDEEENLTELHARLTATLTAYGKSYELLFIDDGSRDGSIEMLKALHERDETVRVFRFVRNFGQQMATAAGLQHARGRVVTLIDADMQVMPEQIPLLVAKLEEGHDIVYGIRVGRQDPLLRRLGSWCMSNLLYRVTGIDIPDSASGFIALDRRLVDSINLFNEKSKYFSGLFAWLSYGRWASVPVQHSPRRAGVSKYNLVKLVGLTFTFVCNFSTAPLRFALFAGMALFGVCGLLFPLFFLARMSDLVSSRVDLWLLLTGAGWLTSLQLIGVGVLGEYIARIFAEVKERPSYIIGQALDRNPKEASG